MQGGGLRTAGNLYAERTDGDWARRRHRPTRSSPKSGREYVEYPARGSSKAPTSRWPSERRDPSARSLQSCETAVEQVGAPVGGFDAVAVARGGHRHPARPRRSLWYDSADATHHDQLPRDDSVCAHRGAHAACRADQRFHRVRSRWPGLRPAARPPGVRLGLQAV